MVAVSESREPHELSVRKVWESLELSDDEAMMKRKRNGTEYDRRIDQLGRLPAPICIFNPKKERKE